MSKEKQQKEFKTDTFENEHLKVKTEHHPGCKIVMEIEVAPKAVGAAYHQAAKAVNKEVSLPGFRKGKAPSQLIIQHFGKYVDQEWRDKLVQMTFQEAIKLTGIHPLSRETIQKPELKKASLEEGATLSFAFEATPNLPEVDPKTLTLKPIAKKVVTDEDVNTALENLRLHHASWEEVTGRPAQEGDYVEVDIEDADRPGHFICVDTRFEAVREKMGDWMLQLVLGKEPGTTVEGISERSEDMDPEASFTPTRCVITIKKIKKAHLPDIDDELAKKTGVDSAEELRKKIVNSLELQSEEEVRKKLRDQVDKLLAETYTFDIPASLVQQEVKNRLDYTKRSLQKLEKTEEQIAQALDELQNKLDEEVVRSFRLFFLARHIADQNQISVTQKELIQELMTQMYTQASPIDTSLDPEEVRSKIYVNLLFRKVKDFLIDRATIE